MTSDDQFFFDYLSSIPHSVWKYSSQVADSVDHQVNQAATVVRDTASEQSWLPRSIRPTPRTPVPTPRAQSFSHRVHDWLLQNRAWSAAALAFIGTGCVLYYGNRKLRSNKRRARRAGNGARKEIVVVIGPPREPMAMSIASDLERRGYIVYVTVRTTADERIVQSANRVDIRALQMDLESGSSSEIHHSVREIHSLITQPQSPSPGVPAHTCQLSGLIVVPLSGYETGPVTTISSWGETTNRRIAEPLLMAQQFMRLLTLRNTHSNIVVVYPSISSSLSAPYAGPEILTANALSGYAAALRRDFSFLPNSNVSVVEVKLGNIDLASSSRSRNVDPEFLAFVTERRVLSSSQTSSSEGPPVSSPSIVRGSPARHLHHAVLQALEPPSKNIFGQKTAKAPVLYAGRGARTYSVIGAWVPSGLVGWMLGLRSGYRVVNSGNEAGWEKV